VKELSDEAFGRVTDVSFPVEKIIDCLRLLAGVYVSRALDMHLLLFHEMVQAESTTTTEHKPRRGGDIDHHKVGGTPPPPQQPKPPSIGTLASSSAEKHNNSSGEMGRPSVVGSGEATAAAASRSTMPAEGGPGTGGSSSGGGYRGGEGSSGGSDGRANSATTGKNGRFATSGRVREFRAVLKGTAAHASKMKAAHANRELNLEGLIRGHGVDAAALNKSTNPGSQSKQQIGRVARAREAVDNMLKRWPVVIERVGICAEQAIKIRSMVKNAGVLLGGTSTSSSTAASRHDSPSSNTRKCEKLRLAREHGRMVEKHAEILVLSLRFERVALAIQRRQEEREYRRQAALGLVPPGVTM
ncbi:unnamed protein product, partial [Laminaria digitata]